MRIIGKYMGTNIGNPPIIGYGTSVCIDGVNAVYISPMKRGNEKKFIIVFLCGSYIYLAKKKGEYLAKNEADAFVKTIYKQEAVDLNEYGLCLYAIERIYNEVLVRNAYDPYSFDPIPITVCNE